MRKSLVILTVFFTLIAGRLAFGSDAGASGGMIGVNWETALTVYGPMGGVIIWFMTRERKRDERLFALVEKCTGVMAKVETSLAQSAADDEKQRTAIYQLRDAVRDFEAHVTAAPMHSKTRVIRRDEEE